ncbi:MAG TPA: hypothetical protein VHO29_00410 [Marmoricola sp.]|nr:hypothetical protein [Marmoricola sp.]
MGNTNARGRTSGRRAAALLAALGALVMSSGVALMVTATPANATAGGGSTKVGVCHATSSDHNPYVWIVVDDDSTKYQGHLKHRNNPVHHWQTAGTWNGIDHAAGGAKRDYIQGLDEGVTEAWCNAQTDVEEATADVDFNDPTCAAPDSGTIDTAGNNVEFTIVPDKATYSIGDTVTVDATATGDTSFAEGAEKRWEHTFKASDAVEGVCPEVSAPVTPSVSFTEPTCTTPAGYTGTNTDKVKYAVTSGSVAPGSDVVVTASPIGDTQLAGDTTFRHQFAGVPANCTTVAPPTSQVEGTTVVSPPKAHVKTKTHAQAATVTPTVVEAGLTSTTTQDLRGEQGLALVAAGMVMLIGAGGLTLRVRRAAARI